MHISGHIIRLHSQSRCKATKSTAYRIESLTPVKHPWTTLTSEFFSFMSPSLQTPSSVNLIHVDLTLTYHPFIVAYLNICLVPLLAVLIDCFYNVKAQRCKESKCFDRGQVATGDTFRMDACTHVRTDDCKNSTITIVLYIATIILPLNNRCIIAVYNNKISTLSNCKLHH